MLSVDSFQFVKLGFSLTHIFYPNQTFCMNNCALEENLIDPPVFARMVVIKSTKKAQYLHLSLNPAICKYPNLPKKLGPNVFALHRVHPVAPRPRPDLDDGVPRWVGVCRRRGLCPRQWGGGHRADCRNQFSLFAQNFLCAEIFARNFHSEPCMNHFHSAVYESCNRNAWSMLSNAWYIHIFIQNS